MNNKIIIFLLFSVGCGKEEDPDFTTTQGMKVFDETGRATEDELSQLLSDYLDLAPGKDTMFKNWELHLVKDPIECGASSNNGLCAGVTYTDYMIVRVQIGTQGCIVHSALDHEFTHVTQWYMENKIDYDHVESFYWDPERGLSEVTFILSRNTICGEDILVPDLLAQ